MLEISPPGNSVTRLNLGYHGQTVSHECWHPGCGLERSAGGLETSERQKDSSEHSRENECVYIGPCGHPSPYNNHKNIRS